MDVKTENTLRAVGDHWLTADRKWVHEGIEDRRGYLLIKRSFDVVVSFFVIAGILSWLLPLLAILIKLDSKGPVFFIQKRVGRNARLFNCYKLRSMLCNDLADVRSVYVNDIRITRLGYWMRRTHIDELPQFFNVMLGAMSIVGPRPYMPADCIQFDEFVPDGAFRHRLRPGITGMAQSKGLHGSVSGDRLIICARYRWDAYYVNHADFRLDVRILGNTLQLLLWGRSRW